MNDPDSYCITCEKPHHACICARRLRVKMLRSSNDGLAMLVAEGPDARAWARERGTIAGYEWFWQGSDFAYAHIEVSDGTPDLIRSEGYDLDTTDYDSPAP